MQHLHYIQIGWNKKKCTSNTSGFANSKMIIKLKKLSKETRKKVLPEKRTVFTTILN